MIDLNQKNQFAKREEEILKFWQEKKIFEKSLKKKSPKGDYVFYDGPPFATGTPHYGHIVASLMKDAVPRFWTMNGYQVNRRWGWDCHGLPIENLVEQEQGIATKKDIEEKIGVCGFNEACRLSVMRYAEVWKKFIPRIGRWVDMENDYKTLDPTYMESIWWVFKTLYDRGLIYESYKSMHICPHCETTLSNFEVTQNYKDIEDISVVAKFELVDEPGTYVLAWTTTPWTLIGNVALAINPKIDYKKVEFLKNTVYKNFNFIKGKNYIVSKDFIEKNFAIVPKGIEEGEKAKNYNLYHLVNKNDIKIKIFDFNINRLLGKKYKSLFDYYLDKNLPNKKNLYKIVAANFVSTEEGTGIVHIAPAFGEEDMLLAQKEKLPFIQHVDISGRFKSEVKDWPNEEAKPATNPQATDKKIVDFLTAKNLIFKAENYTHSYPHCWRCDTPLLNYATFSWFVKVTAIKEKMIKNNKQINWVPAHLKDGRFGKWLENAQDWAISRQRYWGATIPVWQCDEYMDTKTGKIKPQHTVVIGSIEELEKLSGKKINDLHKHIVDEVTFKCEKCGGEMKRVPDVLDCWFESGSMPYAQIHYPFENKKWFEKNFPAQFIAEGVDQTRGWFYTLVVLSTALFNKPAFLNVIANGIVLTEDGKKMSKRLKNYPEPDLVIDKYGADALRYYLLTSPVMAAENLNFSEPGVKEALQKVVMLLNNVLSFYLMYKTAKTPTKPKVKNILDRWILAKLNLLTQKITDQMKNYQLVNACRPIGEFVNELSTWYLRRSRERFKAGDKDGINTLSFVLLEFSKIIAPFLPFTAEETYQKIGGKIESVHLEDWPEVDKKLIDKKLLEQMDIVRQIVEKGLAARAEAKIKVRQPLASLKLKVENEKFKINEDLLNLIKDELNVKEVIFDEKIENEVELDTKITESLKLEGRLRDLIRQINQLRKEKSLTINDKIMLYYQGEGLKRIFKNFGKEIKKSTLAEETKEGEIKEMKPVEGGKVGIEKIS